MAKKRVRKVKNGNKSSIGNSKSLVASEVHANQVNHTFLPNDTVMRSSTIDDDWWEEIPVPGYASKNRLLHKLQQDVIHGDSRIVTSPFMNWWTHVGSRGLPDHLPREHKISVSPTLPDVPVTPEIRRVERRLHQERFDNMWDEETENLSSNTSLIKSTCGPVLKKPQPSPASCPTEKTLERELHEFVSGNLSDEQSKDFTNKTRKQKGSKLIRRKDNYRKLELLNEVKQFELLNQNESYESSKEHSSESKTVKRHKNQLSKLISSENNSISYPSVSDTSDNSLPERVRKTGRFDDVFQDGTLGLTNKDLNLPTNSNKIPSDLSDVTEIKERLSHSFSNTHEMRRAHKLQKLLNLSWSGQTDLHNSKMQQRRNIRTPLEVTNHSVKNAFDAAKKTPKISSKNLNGSIQVSSNDKSAHQEQILNIDNKNDISSEKLLTHLSQSRRQKFLEKMSSLSDTTGSELPLHDPTPVPISSSFQFTRDTSVAKVPTVSKVKSKFLQNLFQDKSSGTDSSFAESSTWAEKEHVQSRASRNAKRGLIADKLLALSDVSENSEELQNENHLGEETLKNSRRDSPATQNVNAERKAKFAKSPAISDFTSIQSTAWQLQEGRKFSSGFGQSFGAENSTDLHSRNYETDVFNLQSNASDLKEVAENSNDFFFTKSRKRGKHGVLEPKNSRGDLSASEKVSAEERSKGSQLKIVTDSQRKQSTELQMSLQDISRHHMSKEISSNVQYAREIINDVSKSDSKINNKSKILLETENKKQKYFESSTLSAQEASKSLMGADKMPKRRSQRISLHHSKIVNDVSEFLSNESSHSSDDENLNDSTDSATRRKVEQVVANPKDLSASEERSVQETSKGSKLDIVTDSPSKQSTKLQTSLQELSRHHKSKEISSNVQYTREIINEDISKSESEVNNESKTLLETDNKKQKYFESSTLSAQEASKSLMGADKMPKRRSQRISSHHSKMVNDVSEFLSNESSHLRNLNDSTDSATRRKVEQVVANPKDLSASEERSVQETSKGSKLDIVTDSPSKQSTKLQTSLRELSRHHKSKEISSNVQYARVIINEHVSKSESEIINKSDLFLETNNKKQMHFERSTLSDHKASKSFFGTGQTLKHASLHISSQDLKINDNGVSNLLCDKSLVQGIDKNSIDSNCVPERKAEQGLVLQKNSREDLCVPGKINSGETMKHSMSDRINSADKQITTLQKCLQDLSRSFGKKRVSVDENYEKKITHEGSVSKLSDLKSGVLEIPEEAQSHVRSNVHSCNKEGSTSFLEITQTSKHNDRRMSVDSVTDSDSPVIAHGVKRRMIKYKGWERKSIAHGSKSNPGISITQSAMKLVPSQQHDSRVKNNSFMINMSHSSREIAKSPENIAINKSEPQRLNDDTQMKSVIRTHMSISNKDKYQKGISDENVKNTLFHSAQLSTKSSTSQSSLPKSMAITPDSKGSPDKYGKDLKAKKHESVKSNTAGNEALISKSVFIGNKFHTLSLKESRPKKDEQNVSVKGSPSRVENNSSVISQKLATVRSSSKTAVMQLHHKRLQEKLTLLEYQKSCDQKQRYHTKYANLRKLLAHREKLAGIFNNNDLLSSKNNISNIVSLKKDIEENAKRETERLASIMKYVQTTKSPLRVSWGNADRHPKMPASVQRTKTKLKKKQNTSNAEVKIVRNVKKAPRMKRPSWLHTRLYKSLSQSVIMKLGKNVINPEKESEEIISKLASLIEKALHYRRKGCNPFVDEVIKHLYHSAIIKTPMNFMCFCMRFLPERFIDKALRDKDNDSGILGKVIDRDLNL